MLRILLKKGGIHIAQSRNLQKKMNKGLKMLLSNEQVTFLVPHSFFVVRDSLIIMVIEMNPGHIEMNPRVVK